MDDIDQEPECRGARVARYVEAYLAAHPGLSLGELAFRLRADTRDLRRLLNPNEQTVGWRLEDRLAAYFGDDFVEAVFRPVIGRGAKRIKEIERERSEIAARELRVQRAREARRTGGPAPARGVRLAAVEGRAWVAPGGVRPGTVG